MQTEVSTNKLDKGMHSYNVMETQNFLFSYLR